MDVGHGIGWKCVARCCCTSRQIADQSRSNQGGKMPSAKDQPFDPADCYHWQNRPNKSCAPCPPRYKEKPAIHWQRPESMSGDEVVEQQPRHPKKRQISPQLRHAFSAYEEHCAAHQQHEPLQGEGNCEDKQWENNEWDAAFCEHRRRVGDRQRFPKQYAPVATLTMQSISTIKDT